MNKKVLRIWEKIESNKEFTFSSFYNKNKIDPFTQEEIVRSFEKICIDNNSIFITIREESGLFPFDHFYKVIKNHNEIKNMR